MSSWLLVRGEVPNTRARFLASNASPTKGSDALLPIWVVNLQSAGSTRDGVSAVCVDLCGVDDIRTNERSVSDIGRAHNLSIHFLNHRHRR
jgi:hypothetical protein